jgi:hypothetical protein
MHTVHYARFCAEPLEVLREVADFCGLNWSRSFESAIGRVRLRNRDSKWRDCLTEDQQAVLLRTLSRASAAVD